MELFVLAVNAVTADVMGSSPPYSRPPPYFGHALLLFTSSTFCFLNSDSLQPFSTNSQKGSGKEKQEIRGCQKVYFPMKARETRDKREGL